jgi:cardiolipin synthase
MLIPEILHDILQWLPNTIIAITAVFVVFLIVIRKGDPLRTVSWIMVIVSLPLIGIFLYVFFGRNYRKEKIFSRKGLAEIEKFGSLIDEQYSIITTDNTTYDDAISSKKHLMTLALKSSKALLTFYNKVTVLNNGKETFDSIIKELEKAKHHIHLEYYIIEDDETGKKIRDILIKKAKEGIEIRLIYDDVGSWSLDEEFLSPLTDAGVEHYAFMPVRFPRFTNKINYRNHRKIIVIDGKVGFVGGLNIADRYINGNPEIGSWHDTHLCIKGEAASALQVVFLTDWYFVSGIFINSETYINRYKVKDTCLTQIVTSGPDSDWASIMQVYFYAISSAKKHVFISSPYLLPNESILTALKTVALSGVDVRIMLPKKSDSHLVFWASLSYVTELLEAGIKIYFYTEGFNHGKLLMVDGVFVSVGTANMDIRSFDQNFEVNALIYDTDIAEKMESDFLTDLSKSEIASLEEWNNRSKWSLIRESFARLFSPLF